MYGIAPYTSHIPPSSSLPLITIRRKGSTSVEPFFCFPEIDSSGETTDSHHYCHRALDGFICDDSLGTSLTSTIHL